MKKEVFSWSLYDLANTAFTSPFRTIFWPLLVTSFLGGNEFQLGLTVGIATFFVALLVPIFGTISDATQRRMPYIIGSSIIAMVLMSILPYFGLLWDLILTGVMIVAYNVGLTIYNTLLPRIATEKEMGRISGFGIALGFLGTILSLAATYIVMKHYQQNGLFESKAGIIATFPVMALFFLVFSLPLFLTVKDINIRKAKVNVIEIFRKMFHTWRKMASYKGMIPFGISTFLFANAIAAVDVFFFLFAKKEIGVNLLGFMLLFAGQSLGAVFGAYLFGRLADRIGAKRCLQITGFMWIMTITIFILSKSITAFWIAGILGSMAFGGVFSTARTLFVFLTPSKQIGEFFGYSQILGKFTGLLGPVIVGYLIVKYGYDPGLSLVWIILVAAFLVLLKIPDIRKSIY